MNRRTFLQASGALLAQPFVPSFADQISESSKQIYYGYSNTGLGSVLGHTAKDLLKELYPKMDYTFIHEPKDNTIRASQIVKQAPANGDTLLQVNGTIMSLFSCLYRNLPYNPIMDFIPVAFLGEYTYMFVVGPKVSRKVKTIDEYLDWVYEHPEYRDFGTVLYGSESHLAGLTFANEKKIALRAQAYGGTSLMVEDLLDGVLGAGIIATGNAGGAILSGNLRVLAVCSAERHQPLPNIPCFTELGVNNMDFRGWYGWVAPSNMDLDVLLKLHRIVDSLQEHPKFKNMQRKFDLNAIHMSPMDIRRRIISDTEHCEELYKKFQLSQIDYI
ncbi:Bug family tripartite tricarboxylate transporter substrate binding protein [Marinomonas epiphytica]